MKLPFLKRIARNHLYFLFFINGFLFALLTDFFIQDSYEKQLFESIAKTISAEVDQSNEDSILLKALHTSHDLLYNRQDIFLRQKVTGIKSEYLNPISVDLMTAQGACGSYTKVLIRLLKTLGFQTRIAQMKVGVQYGGHIIAEAKTKKGWVVLDPIYDLHFTRPDGSLPSFEDVAKNWNYYKQQLPRNYDMTYRYEGVRYTNWSKIPIISPLSKLSLDLLMGKENADKISIRTYFMRDNLLYSLILLLVAIPLTLYKIVKVFKIRREHFSVGYHLPVLQPITRKITNIGKMLFLLFFLFSLIR